MSLRLNCSIFRHINYAIWHLRLGHVAYSKMKLMSHVVPQKVDAEKVCLTCPMAKFTKLPYNLSSSHAVKLFELVHLDTWGPYKVPTRGKFKYFLTLVDDKSRATLLYLMQHKSDFRSSFLTFYNYVETQFAVKLRI